MKMYAVVGTGSRSELFTEAMAGPFRAKANLLALCDRNPGRLQLAADKLKIAFPNIITYSDQDVDQMLKHHQPDTVIVCTMDSTHDDYICRALEAGCDVITEKPMTIDENRCRRILDTACRTKRKIRIALNYRYSPVRAQMKTLLTDGVIGQILSVEFQWLLDTTHGADYFRRWHRNKSNSGGLIVHKATHHFDLVNWWIGDCPETVFARGGRVFYNQAQARRLRLANHTGRCLDCPVAKQCNYFIDLSAIDSFKRLYLNNEHHDGYLRDQCIFANEIDIEDCINVIVQYRRGAFLSYSLNAFSPWEGYQIVFNGTKGRLEHRCRESSYINGNGDVPAEIQQNETRIQVFPHFKTPYDVEACRSPGGHGGGDPAMLHDIFNETPFHDEHIPYVPDACHMIDGNRTISNAPFGSKPPK